MNVNDVLHRLLEEIRLEDFSVIYDPNKRSAEAGEMLIGIGNSSSNSEGIVLNNKLFNLNTVSELVTKATEDEVSEWRGKWHHGTSEIPNSVFVEDLSPDTLLGFILFYIRVNKLEATAISSEWVHYVNDWKKGDVKTTGIPEKSWGCLINALGHDYFGTKRKIAKEMIIKHGFLACLNLTCHILLEGFKPYDIKELQHVEEYHRAKAIVTNDYQEYLRILSNAETIQLLLPFKNSDREVLVDAFLASEDQPLARYKAFIRNDTQHSWLKAGFGLMAVHCERAAGTGNDMVISVEPSLGIHLKDLWERLEVLEDEKWGEDRPCDDPRYKEDLRSKANQPWYDENKNYTMIAAPKMINETTYGTKLTWKNVIDTLWELYHPLKNLTVQPYQANATLGDRCTIDACEPLVYDHNKQFLAMKWSSFGHRRSMPLSPTVKRFFAAIADSKLQDKITVSNLPPIPSFDFLELPGGFTVIHRNGVLFFDDWTKDDSRVEIYKTEFEHLLLRYNVFEKLHKQIKEQIQSIREKLHDQKTIKKEIHTLNSELTEIKMELRDTLLNTMPSSQEYNIQRFREQVEKRWGLHTQLDELYESVTELENIVKNTVETKTSDLINKISIYGFPVAITSGIFAFIIEDFFKDGIIHKWGLLIAITSTVLLILWLEERLNK